MNKEVTCEDCIGYEICCNWSVIKNGDDLHICSVFKNKRLFAELPCEIGSTLYKVVYNTTACNRCKDYGDFFGCCDKGYEMFPAFIPDYVSDKPICPKHSLKINTLKKVSLAEITDLMPLIGFSVFLDKTSAKRAIEEYLKVEVR